VKQKPLLASLTSDPIPIVQLSNRADVNIGNPEQMEIAEENVLPVKPILLAVCEF
jgi:hypothetical protein